MSSLKMCDRKTEIEAAGKRDNAAGGNLPEGVSMTAYDVFPGITVIYNDIRAERFSGRSYESGSIFEINHCRKGRIEYELAEGEGDEFRYLAPGDLSISCRTDFREDAYFPLHYYQGITILIDTGQTPGCLSCFLDDVEVHPELLMKKFDNNGRGYITRSNESIEHIFSELYSVPEEIKKGYLKVKILELLLFLSAMEPEAAEETKMVSAAHARLAKDICRYLTERMDRKVTLDMLAETFHVSATLIKTCFKDVYGVSVYSYIRTQKMEKAAVMLRETEMQITEIAGALGYDNSSKFAKAFKDIQGVTPGAYRKKQSL